MRRRLLLRSAESSGLLESPPPWHAVGAASHHSQQSTTTQILGSRMTGKGNGKGLMFTMKPRGWRSNLEGDPHNRHVTMSARRIEQTTVEEPVHGHESEDTDQTQVQETHDDASEQSESMDGVQHRPCDDSYFRTHIDAVAGDELSGGNVRPRRGTDGRYVPMRVGTQTGSRSQPGSSSSSAAQPKKRGRSDSDWIITEAMPGGPVSTLVIPSYGGHIARDIWLGVERSPALLECMTRKIALRHLRELLDVMPEDVIGDIQGSPLYGLHELMYEHLDVALIAAFVERWQPDTNTFHMPFGEMTIMLHDVEQLLGLPVEGDLPSCSSRGDLEFAISSIFPGVRDVMKDKSIYDKGGIIDCRLRKICTDDRSRAMKARAWHLSLLGSTILADKSRDKVRPHPFDSTEHVDSVAWGTVALAYLYRQLGIASRASTSMISGCLTLLQAWIYEHFVIFRPHPPRSVDFDVQPRAATWFPRSEERSVDRLVSIRRAIDGMSERQVIWCPYSSRPADSCVRTLYAGWIRAYDVTEPYCPWRTVRQLGYEQPVPGPVDPPAQATRPRSGSYIVKIPDRVIDHCWRRFPLVGKISLDELTRASFPWDTTMDYSTWFCNVSHPQLVNEDIPISGSDQDPTSSDYWMHELSRVLMPVLDIPEGEPLPADMHRGIKDLLRSWCHTMHIDPKRATTPRPDS